MSVYLLDTTTLSLLMRESASAIGHLETMAAGDRITTSVIVRGEIGYGLAKVAAGRRRRDLVVRAAALLRELPCEPVSSSIADRYAVLECGRTLVTSDSDFGRVEALRLADWSRGA